LGYLIVYNRWIYSSSKDDLFYFNDENLVMFSKAEADNLCFGARTTIFLIKADNYLEYLNGDIGAYTPVLILLYSPAKSLPEKGGVKVAIS
jgi:hypothetical protein